MHWGYFLCFDIWSFFYSFIYVMRLRVCFR